MRILDYIKLCRPAHIIKNFLVLLPPFFAHKALDWQIAGSAVGAVLSFSFLASIVYIINDLMDCEKDRQHATKKNRPIASGRVSKAEAAGLAVLLAVGGSLLVYFFSTSWIHALILAIAYLLMNIAYSAELKNVPVIDIFILALGFVLRVYYGGAWFEITISPWLFLCILSAALCFASGKRRNELLHAKDPKSSRPVLQKYSSQYLTCSYYLFCGMTIVFFSLWTIFGVQNSHILQFTIPFVICIMMRYNLIIETTDTDGDPVPTLLKDKILIGLVLLFGGISFWALYFS